MPRHALTPRAVFPPDRGLEIRVALVLAGNALYWGVVLAGAVMLGFVAPKVLAVLAFAVVMTLLLPGAFGRGGRPPAPVPAGSRPAQRALHALERVCSAAGHPVPPVTVVRAEVPVSWTACGRRGGATIQVTTGLLEEVDDTGLLAVLAHELSHIVHGDARALAWVLAPTDLLARRLGGSGAGTGDGRIPAAGDLLLRSIALVVMVVPLVLCLPSWALASALSRRREFTADRDAALLLDDPGAVADTLPALWEALTQIRGSGRQAVAARPETLLLPMLARSGGLLLRTHPWMERRVARVLSLDSG